MDTDDKIRHLSEIEIKELMKRYYDNEKITTLLDDYNIKCRANELANLFPAEILEELSCCYCNGVMVRDRAYRNAMSYQVKPIYCSSCKHKLDDDNCLCNSCLNEKRMLIEKYYGNNKKDKLNINELNAKTKIYIATLLRGVSIFRDKYGMYIMALKYKKYKLTPVVKSEFKIIAELFKNKVILVHPDSELDGFKGSLRDKSFGKRFAPLDVNFILNFNYIEEDSYLKMLLSESYAEELYEIYKEVALDECYEYLQYQMDVVNLSFVEMKNTRVILLNLIKKFSLGQVFNILNSSVVNARKFYEEKKIYKRQASNFVMMRCKNIGEGVVMKKSNIKSYTRPKGYKESIISEVLFEKVLSIGDKAFTDFIDVEYIRDVIRKNNI